MTHPPRTVKDTSAHQACSLAGYQSPSPCSLPYLPRRAGTELSPSWPGFYEGAIYTAEQAAATVGALLKGQKA